MNKQIYKKHIDNVGLHFQLFFQWVHFILFFWSFHCIFHSPQRKDNAKLSTKGHMLALSVPMATERCRDTLPCTGYPLVAFSV